MTITNLECWSSRRLARARGAEDFSPAERERLDAHLASCRPCAARLNPLDAPLRRLLAEDADLRAAEWGARVPRLRVGSAAGKNNIPTAGGWWPEAGGSFGGRRALAAACALAALLAAAFWMREAWLAPAVEGVRVSEIAFTSPAPAPAVAVEYATLNGMDARVTEYHSPDGDATVIWLSSAF